MMSPLETEIIAASRIADYDQSVDVLRRLRQAELGHRAATGARVRATVQGLVAILARTTGFAGPTWTKHAHARRPSS